MIWADGVPQPSIGIEVDGRVAYVRVPTFTPTMALPVNGEGRHNFVFAGQEGRVFLEEVDGTRHLVALSVPAAPIAAQFGIGATKAELAALDRLSESELRSVVSLRLGTGELSILDFERLPALRALELVFLPPPDELTSSVRRPIRPEDPAERWLASLPDALDLLRLEHPPAAALHALRTSVKRLELDAVAGLSGPLVLDALPVAKQSRTLSVENTPVNLEVAGPTMLRELIVPAIFDHTVGPNGLSDFDVLESLTADQANVGLVWSHPSLRRVDLRGADVWGWSPATVRGPSSIQRMILVDAKSSTGEPLSKIEHEGIVQTALDEVRIAIACAYRIIQRPPLGTPPTERRPVASRSPESLSSWQNILLEGATTQPGHATEPGVALIDLYYDGTAVLTLFVSGDCRRLDAWSWRHHVELAEASARRLCAWLDGIYERPAQ